MNTKEIEERLNNLERKLDKKTIENDWILSAWKHLEKNRNNMIEQGIPFQALNAYDKAVQPIKQRACEIKNLKKKLQLAKEEAERLAKEERLLKQKRAKALVAAVYLPPKFPYNTDCRNFSFVDGEALCGIKMDLQYCNNNCPYCTNRAGSYVTDSQGKIVGTRKRSI